MARVPLKNRIINEDIWNSHVDLIAITTNSHITTLPALVMGRGLAKQAKERYPELPRIAVETIREKTHYHTADNYPVYGFITTFTSSEPYELSPRDRVMGLFQVKYDFRVRASLALIGYSVGCLNNWLYHYHPRELKPDYRVALNFPGISNGGLHEEQVLPLLEDLDDRVLIYKYERQRK